MQDGEQSAVVEIIQHLLRYRHNRIIRRVIIEQESPSVNFEIFLHRMLAFLIELDITTVQQLTSGK